MATAAKSKLTPTPWYRGAAVPRTVIRAYAADVVDRFHPEQIVLFGSHANGVPHLDSDVDILVVMPCRNEIDQACEIDAAFDPPFPLDLIVRSPASVTEALENGDSFITSILEKGEVLYAARNGSLGEKSGKRLQLRKPRRRAVP